MRTPTHFAASGFFSIVQLKAAIGGFFLEFSKFEMAFVGMALRSLTKDSVFVEQTEKLLDLEGRLTLLNRMALARGMPPTIMAELDACLLHARKLRDQRDEIARNLLVTEGNAPRRPRAARGRGADFAQLAELEHLWVPSVAQIQQLATEAIELQEILRTIVEKIERHSQAEFAI